MDTQPKFYVYLLLDEDGIPFYVGKGCGKRIDAHERLARQGDDTHKSRKIRKMWSEGKTVERVVILRTDNEQEAFSKERETIAYFGRQTLCNYTDGGEGISGLNRTAEHIRKVAKANRGRTHSAETKALIAESSRGRKHSPEFIEASRAKMLGNKRAKGPSENNRAVLAQLDWKKINARVAETRKENGYVHSKETKAKMVEACKKRKPISEETREKLRQSHMGNKSALRKTKNQ